MSVMTSQVPLGSRSTAAMAARPSDADATLNSSSRKYSTSSSRTSGFVIDDQDFERSVDRISPGHVVCFPQLSSVLIGLGVVSSKPVARNDSNGMTEHLEPTILVVEDDPDLRELIAETLESDGFTVTQAPDAAAALLHLRAFAFDAVVIDLRLPDADGMRVLDLALDCYPQIVSVVVSGFGGVTEAVAAMKRGGARLLDQAVRAPPAVEGARNRSGSTVSASRER